MLRQVRLPGGIIEGVPSGDPRVTVFKGVPYAKAPVGDLRWRSPQPYDTCWDGVRRMDTFPPMCYQTLPGSDPAEFWTRELNPTATEYRMSEDCLYLNIWSPAKSENEKLPVYFWIHGGGMQAGYSYEMEFNGEKMAREGVIMITVGYRLNIFGWMAHPELTQEEPDAPHGNYCLQDLIFALQWVQDHIEAFGGDPTHVTIGGQSGGAGAVISLLSSPLAKGLFSSAISQSGGGLRAFGYGTDCTLLSDAEQTGIEIFKMLGVTSVDEARRLPANVIYEAYRNIGGGFNRWSPRVDGVLLPESTLDCMIRNHHHDVPYILSYTAGEGPGTPAGGPLPETMQAFRIMMDRIFGAEAEAMIDKYQIGTLEKAIAYCQSDVMNSRFISAHAYLQAEANHMRMADYCCEFDHDIPGEDQPGAYHGSDLWFTFNSVDRSWRPFRGKHYDLARQVIGYWANFIKTGDPNGQDHNGETLPEWKPWSVEDPFVLVFRDEPQRKNSIMSDVAADRIQYHLKSYDNSRKRL